MILKDWRAIYKSWRVDNQASGVQEEGKLGKLIAGLVASSMILGMFALALPLARAQGNAPQWSSGDYWEYAGTDVLYNKSYTEILRLNVIGKESVAVGSGSNETYHCSFSRTIIIRGSVYNSDGDTYLRTSDLAVVKVFINLTALSSEYRFDPPLEEFHFPLYDGQWWHQYGRETNYGTNYFWSFDVSGPETVSVAAGTFSAFIVNGSEQPEPPSRDYYSDTVGFLVKTRGLFLGLPTIVDLDLQSYGHQTGNPSVFPLMVTIIVIIVVFVAVMLILFLISILRSRARKTPPIPPQVPTFPPQG